VKVGREKDPGSPGRLEVSGYELLGQGRIEGLVPATLAFDDDSDGVVPCSLMSRCFDLNVGAQSGESWTAYLNFAVDDDSVAADVL
jgi:hypothetical protein